MKEIINEIFIMSKLNVIIFIFLTLTLLSSGYALNNMFNVGHKSNSIVNPDSPMIGTVTKIAENQLDQILFFEQTLQHARLNIKPIDTMEVITKGITQFNYHDVHISEQLAIAIRLTQQGASNAIKESNRQEFISIAKALKNYEQGYLNFKQYALSVFNLLSQDNYQKAIQHTDEMEKEKDKLTSHNKTLLNDLTMITESAANRTAEHEYDTFRFLSILTLILLIAGILVTWMLSKNIATLMYDSVKDLETIDSKILTNKAGCCGTNEVEKLQQSIENIQQHLCNVIAHISDTAHQLSATADEVSVVTAQNSANIRQQRIKTEQTTTGMARMCATGREVAMNIDNASTPAYEVNRADESGRVMVNRAVHGVRDLGNMEI